MRDLAARGHEFNLIDTVSRSRITVFYRMPTNDERIEYNRACVKTDEQGKTQFDALPARLKYGMDLMTGIAEGHFGIGGKAISSDKKSPLFKKDWKKLVEKTSGDIAMALAMSVFEGLMPIGVAPDPAAAKKSKGEPDVPLS